MTFAEVADETGADDVLVLEAIDEECVVFCVPLESIEEKAAVSLLSCALCSSSDFVFRLLWVLLEEIVDSTPVLQPATSIKNVTNKKMLTVLFIVISPP